MKRLTEEEFNDRVQAFIRAEKIFVKSGITDNITEAFRIYQAVLADRERELHVAPSEHGFMPGSPLNRYERPQCPECGAFMGLRNVPENEDGIKTQLVCMNDACDVVLDSELTIDQWRDKLKVRKDEYQRIREDAQKAKQEGSDSGNG